MDNSLQVDVTLHMDTLSLLREHQSLASPKMLVPSW
jgi:hypothetical protein